MQSKFYRHALALLIPCMLLLAKPVLAQKYVCMQSSQGEWCAELLRSAAPNTVTNFLRYVNDGRYATSIVHRSVPGFVIQGGGFNLVNTTFGVVASYGTINNEFNRSNLRGTMAMAKVGSDPNSATNQWFVNVADTNVFLDLPANNSFTVFANVVYGMDVVDKINALHRVNLSSLVSAFTEMPVDAAANTAQLTAQDVVRITRAYTTDLLPGSTVQPYHCSAPVANEALTELCGTSVTFPVSLVGGGAYEVTLDLLATQPAMVFGVRAGGLKPISLLPNTYATFNPVTNVAVIPSVRAGSVIYDNVQLLMTNVASMQLTLQSFKQR